MSEGQTTEVVRRSPNQVNRREVERRSRPDSAHKGNLKRLKTSSVSGFQRWEKENELLWAMLEDETDWLAKLFPDIIITPELFFYALEDGVVLCRLANLIQETADEYGKKNNIKVSGKRFKFHTSIQKKNKQLALFKSRENVQGFLTWCRQLGISDSILFESNDIVEADECREGCREVVICLMEIARRASGRFKFTPIPKLIQLEKEIEAEEQQDAEANHFDQVDYASSDEESTDSGHGQSLDHSSPPLNSDHENNHSTPGGTKKKPKKQHPKSELDTEVFKIIDNFNVYNIRKIKEGKYMILGKIIFVRMLNGHVLLRIGGGWDTLEHYLLTHLPKAASENTQSQSEAAVSPSVPKTPQKSQLTKILDKVKKEQQLKKATPVSSPHRTAASKQQEESSEDDEKDITSAIRKIEFSVNQNIATRRKHSKVSAEETPVQKSPSVTPELKRNTPSDINQNSIEQKLCEDQLKQYPQAEKTPCFNNCSKKMDDEVPRTGSEFSEQGINGNSEPNSGVGEQNGEGSLITFEGSSGNEGFDVNEAKKSEEEGHSVGEATDLVDAGFGAHLDAHETAARDSPDIKVSEYVEGVGDDVVAVESCNGGSADLDNKPATQEGDNVTEETSQNSCDANIKEQSDSPAPEQLSGVESPTETSDIPPISADNVTDSNHVGNEPTAAAPDISAPAPAGDTAPGSDKRTGSPQEKKGAESPKKKVAKNTKEPLKSKQTTGRVTAAKKDPPGSTGARPKSAHTKPTARATTAESAAAKNGAKRPTSTVKSTTTSPTKPNPTSSTTTKKLRSSPTHSAAAKKPASKPESKTVASTRPARPTKTSAFGSSVSSKPAATKKPGDSGRPATAPPARSTQVKGKPVLAKVQTGSSSSRPHSARPATKPATTASKDATDGGAASKGTGKPLKTTGAARPTSPTKPLVRKTQTRTVTTLKTTKLGASGEPEVKSQTIKTTRTVTEANGKKTTKMTVKEVAPPGRKPLRLTKTETTEVRGAPGKKTGSAEAKPGTRTAKPGTKKPETKTKAGGAPRVGSAGPSKTTKGLGTRKPTTKTDVKSEQKVSSHLKGTIPKAKTVKELSNALGITKSVTPSPEPEPTVKTPEPETKPAEEPTTPQDESKPVEAGSEDFGNNVIEKEDDNIVERVGEVVVDKMEEKTVETVEERVVEKVDEENVREASEVNEKNEIEKEEDVEKQGEENNEKPAQTEVEESKEIVVEEKNNVINNIVDEIHGEEETEHVLVETEHALIETEHGPVETEHEVVETEHELVETEHGPVETEHEVVETEHEVVETGHGIEEPEHALVETEHGLVETEHEIAPESLGNDWKFTTSAATTTFTTEDREQVSVEDKEISLSPEVVENVENVPTEDDFQQETLEDSLDVIHVPPDETSNEETKFEKIEAWPAVDDYSQHAPSGETGDGDSEGEPEEELEGIGESDVSSPDIPEQHFDEESQPDVLAEERPQIDPWDPDANRVSPCVSPQATFETEKNTEYPDIGSHVDNNNIAEPFLEPEPQLDPDLHSAPAISDEEPFPGTGEESRGEAGDEQTQLLLEDFNECSKPGPQIDFLEFTGFQGNEGTSKEENGGESPATVDDLLA